MDAFISHLFYFLLGVHDDGDTHMFGRQAKPSDAHLIYLSIKSRIEKLKSSAALLQNTSTSTSVK